MHRTMNSEPTRSPTENRGPRGASIWPYPQDRNISPRHRVADHLVVREDLVARLSAYDRRPADAASQANGGLDKDARRVARLEGIHPCRH